MSLPPCVLLHSAECLHSMLATTHHEDVAIQVKELLRYPFEGRPISLSSEPVNNAAGVPNFETAKAREEERPVTKLRTLNAITK